MKGKYEQKKVGLKSHSDVYRVRRRPAYSSVTPFLILAKQGAAAPLDVRYYVTLPFVTGVNSFGLIPTMTGHLLSYPARLELLPPGGS